MILIGGKEVKLFDFLHEVGRFARVGTMMTGYYTEFTYQLLQGYDFLHLFRNEGVSVQIGGSDQWGYITAGTELIRKILQVEGAYGLTFPILLKSDGTKFGKSEDMIPAVLSLEEIKEVEEGMKKSGYVPNSAQRKLAEEVTRFVHGEEGLQEALKATEALKPGAETKLDWKTIEGIAKDVPSCYLSYDQVLNASVIYLSVTTGLFESKSSVRRMSGKIVEAGDIIDGKILLLSSGNKNKMVVRISLSLFSLSSSSFRVENLSAFYMFSCCVQNQDFT
ncbi:hypothetical protein MKW94_018466 [Papaver nudicaule]|uniref:tyrosine--tRNA ligase n=1 Tax=Papaver nudicaule TaxID=74823 RepID=A0AA41RYW7_PAPNU|nr:hypothetical protein [Papaver nudicaule]